MNTFVKIKGYPNWFLFIRDESELSEEMEEQAQERIKTVIGERVLHGDQPQKDFNMFGFAAMHKPDYRGCLQKTNKPLLIRPIGSYMTLHESNEIIEQVESEGFPTEKAEIAICENDQDPQKEWVKYLKNRFPNKSIKTINFFGTRTVEDIKMQFEGVKYITFSTTFSNMDWFKKVLEATNENQEVIGFCWTESNWDEALELAKEKGFDIEVVESI